jgi:hypothetical protein
MQPNAQFHVVQQIRTLKDNLHIEGQISLPNIARSFAVDWQVSGSGASVYNSAGIFRGHALINQILCRVNRIRTNSES